MKYITIIILLLICTAIGAKSQVAVIANKSVPISNIDVSKLISIYNLNTKAWDNGAKIIVVNLKAGDSKDKFYLALKSTESDMRKVWLKKKLSDGTEVPVNVGSEDEMVNYVKSNPGAIGFVSKSKVSKDVKVLIEF